MLTLKDLVVGLILLTVWLCMGNAHAQEQCVMPKSHVAKNGWLVVDQPVAVFKEQTGAIRNVVSVIDHPQAYWVSDEINGFVLISTTPNYNLYEPNSTANRKVGWVRKSDMEQVPLRSCQ